MSASVPPRPACIEVDLDAIAHNHAIIRQHTGVPVMAIVKANGYGHGLVPVARRLLQAGAAQLGVAFIEEAICLREAGIQAPILVLGGLHAPQIASYLHYRLEITVSSLQGLRQVEGAVQAAGQQAIIHLKLDTGMGRIGVEAADAAGFIEAACNSPHCHVKGVYSHLACADDPNSEMTAQQLARFLAACAHFERIGAPMPIRHLANSGGVLHFPETWLDMVRPGILLYGVLPDHASRRTLDTRPALSLKSRALHVKHVAAGTPISYGATWHASQRSGILTVPVGYGDGWPRSLSSPHGMVLSGGRPHPIAGRVCMDQFMVDIGTDDGQYGDEVVLIGRQGDAEIRVEDVAIAAGTIPYEILVRLNERLPRRYFGDSPRSA